MNTQAKSEINPVPDKAQRVKLPARRDPILDELWRIKAALNAEAGYDAKTLLQRAAAARTARELVEYQMARYNIFQPRKPL